jgi:hypothetical protein
MAFPYPLCTFIGKEVFFMKKKDTKDKKNTKWGKSK